MATLLVIAAIVYFIVPWDLDFVPLVGRLDDVLFLVIAVYYYRKQMQGRESRTGRRPATEHAPADPSPSGQQSEVDPYRLLGVSSGDDVETIKKAYRDLVAKYHPDRVGHLGEEFQVMAASKTTAINKAYEEIKKARSFS